MANEVITTKVPDSSVIEHALAGVVQRAEAFVCETEADLAAGELEIVDITRGRAFAVELYRDAKSGSHKLWRSICEKERTFTDAYDQARGLITSKCIEFRKRAKREAEDAARRKQEEERRLAEEAKLLDAMAADAAGAPEEAEIIRQAPVVVPVVAVKEPPKTPGVAPMVKTWGAHVVDFRALVKHVAAHIDEDPGLEAYLEPAMPALNRKAVSERENMRLPGVEARLTESYRVRLK